MRLLIDTQILIWFFEDNELLPARLYAQIADADNEIFVGQVSLFEIAIKLKIGGRLTLKRGLPGLVEDCQKADITILPLEDEHLLAYDQIPFYADHRDPFDRLILATALAEEMPVISADETFQRYQPAVAVIW